MTPQLRSPLLASALVALTLVGAGCTNNVNPGLFGLNPNGTPVVNFTLTDLQGDWIGWLDPMPPLMDRVPFFIRHDGGGFPSHCRDGMGTIYDENDTTMSAFVQQGGKLQIVMEQQSGQRAYSVVMNGQLDASGLLHAGSYDLYLNGLYKGSGDYEAWPTSGPGHFSPELLDGLWEGRGRNQRNPNKGAKVTVEIDHGDVMSGEIEALHTFVSQGPNVAAFTFADDSVGLLENVEIETTDGTIVKMPFALVDQDGEILAGPIEDLWRPGVVRLEKQ